MFGLQCCCKRREDGPMMPGHMPPSSIGGGAPGNNGTTKVPPIFQQPITSASEPVSADELSKRENLLVAQLFLRGTVFNLAERDYFYLGRREYKEKCSFMLHDPYGPPKLMTMISATPSNGPSLGTSSGKLRVQRTLLGLRFPFVQPLVCAEYLTEKKKLVVVRVFSDDQTMRQVIYGQKYTQDEDAHVIGSPLSLSHVGQYGRQILEAICFLRHKGISCAHLHLGNIFVDVDTTTCRLTDFENGLVGVPPQLLPFVTSATKLIRDTTPGTEVDVDVLCFYHVVHEMTLGYAPGGSPNSADPLRVPQTAPRSIQKIFKDILKGRITTVIQLLDLELFAEAPLPDHITAFSSYKAKLSQQSTPVAAAAASKSSADQDDADEISA